MSGQSGLVGTSIAAERAVERVQAEFNKLSAEILEIRSTVNTGTQGWTGTLASDFRTKTVPQAMSQWSEFAAQGNKIFASSLSVQNHIQVVGGNRR